jgi:hypothetical protein
MEGMKERKLLYAQPAVGTDPRFTIGIAQRPGASNSVPPGKNTRGQAPRCATGIAPRPDASNSASRGQSAGAELRPGAKALGVFVGVCYILNPYKHSRRGNWALAVGRSAPELVSIEISHVILENSKINDDEGSLYAGAGT